MKNKKIFFLCTIFIYFNIIITRLYNSNSYTFGCDNDDPLAAIYASHATIGQPTEEIQQQFTKVAQQFTSLLLFLAKKKLDSLRSLAYQYFSSVNLSNTANSAETNQIPITIENTPYE